MATANPELEFVVQQWPVNALRNIVWMTGCIAVATWFSQNQFARTRIVTTGRWSQFYATCIKGLARFHTAIQCRALITHRSLTNSCPEYSAHQWSPDTTGLIARAWPPMITRQARPVLRYESIWLPPPKQSGSYVRFSLTLWLKRAELEKGWSGFAPDLSINRLWIARTGRWARKQTSVISLLNQIGSCRV